MTDSPDLKSTLYTKDNFFLFLINYEMVKVDIEKGSFKKIQMRKSKVLGRNKILAMTKISEKQLLCLSEEFCLKVLEIASNEKDENLQTWGFLCPFCLRLFSTQFSLYRDHVDVHKGPVICEICKVSEKTLIHLLILFSPPSLFSCMILF